MLCKLLLMTIHVTLECTNNIHKKKKKELNWPWMLFIDLVSELFLFFFFPQWKRHHSLVRHFKQLCRLFILSCYSVEVLKKWACQFSSGLYFVEGREIKSHLKFTFDICERQRHWVCVISRTGKTRAKGDWQSVKRDPGGEVASDFQGLCLLIWSTSHGYLCGNEQPLSPGTFTWVLALLQLCADMSWWDIAA